MGDWDMARDERVKRAAEISRDTMGSIFTRQQVIV